MPQKVCYSQFSQADVFIFVFSAMIEQNRTEDPKRPIQSLKLELVI